MDVVLRTPEGAGAKRPVCVLLHLDGMPAALKHPLAAALVKAGWAVAAPNLRATGAAEPQNNRVHDAADHNSSEHALWIGRPLFGQWLFDAQVLLDWLALQPTIDRRRVVVAGVGLAGLLAESSGGPSGEGVCPSFSVRGAFRNRGRAFTTRCRYATPSLACPPSMKMTPSAYIAKV